MNNKKKKNEYWLYLEPYTFIFKGEIGALIYNSLSSHTYKINYTTKILNLLNRLKDSYVTKISDEDLQDNSVKEFIKNIRNSFSGDLISRVNNPRKPVVIYPFLNVQMGIKNLKRDPELSLEQSLPDQLTELSFYITGQCKQSCGYCYKDKYRKQFPFCYKSPYILELEKVSKVLNQASGLVSKVNILGGDIFVYPEWMKLIIR